MAPHTEVSSAAAAAGDAPSQAMVKRVFVLAEEVLGSEGNVLAWLQRPHEVLGAAPVTLMHSRAGLEAVEEELQALSHGIV
jgi:uncharacterized protein (DUF2384 family)